MTCIVMWLSFTWTWHSCGGARCPGVRRGRARHRIAWIMFGGGGVHDVPWDVKSASMEQFVPPWTVQCPVWSDSLKASYSGISTDVLLFSDINLSLVHHYRIHKRQLPHIAFRRDYMARLRALLSPAVAHSRGEMLSPVLSGPVSTLHVRSAELENQMCQASDAASTSPG